MQHADQPENRIICHVEDRKLACTQLTMPHTTKPRSPCMNVSTFIPPAIRLPCCHAAIRPAMRPASRLQQGCGPVSRFHWYMLCAMVYPKAAAETAITTAMAEIAYVRYPKISYLAHAGHLGISTAFRQQAKFAFTLHTPAEYCHSAIGSAMWPANKLRLGCGQPTCRLAIRLRLGPVPATSTLSWACLCPDAAPVR